MFYLNYPLIILRPRLVLIERGFYFKLVNETFKILFYFVALPVVYSLPAWSPKAVSVFIVV
ncbi:MAG: hypothetical protein C0154_01965 [Mucilaginibacter sp.]|nr:MAG: hypothetical protein C0154_01965 [Mucilaginibacter sp.]